MLKEPKNYVVYNGKNLADFGVYVSGDGTFGSAERDYEIVEVPGRSGDLLFDNKRFKNVTVHYNAWIAENMDQNLMSLRDFLARDFGYHKLEDTYHPDEYRLGYFRGPISPSVALLKFSSFDLEFSCKPQRFLKVGDDPIEVPADKTLSLYNPTGMPAKPLIRVYGHGKINFSVDGSSVAFIEILEHDEEWIDIDCDLMDCYCEDVNLNNKVSFPGLRQDFPTLGPGATDVDCVTDMPGYTDQMQVFISPRWWRV